MVTRERVIVIISDGEEPEQKSNPVDAARAAVGDGIRTFALGIGSPEGSSVDVIDPETGRPALTVPDFKKLESVARAGRGAFVEWTNNDNDLNELAYGISNAIEPAAFETVVTSRAIEFSLLTIRPYQILIFLAIVFICIETFFKY